MPGPLPPSASLSSAPHPWMPKLPALPPTPTKAVDPEAELKREADAAAQVLIARASNAEGKVTTRLTAIAKDNKAKMEGLNYKLKTESSLARKLADRARTRVVSGDYKAAVAAEAAKMNDVLRYTMLISKKTYKKVDDQLRITLQRDGYQLTNYWNAWEAADSQVYNGINMTFKTSDDQLFEVQLHTKDSFKTKQSIHDLYEEWRASTTTPARKAELAEEMKKKWKKVPTPSGIKKAGSK